MAPPPSDDKIDICISLGGYMYIESSNARKNSKARLASPIIWNKKGVSSCLTFYYHMWGEHIGLLAVVL